MRHYKTAVFFRHQDFPLMVTQSRQQDFMEEHDHDFIELVLVNSGKSLHKLTMQNGQKASYALIRGEIFAVKPGEIHSYCESKNFEIYNVAFHPQLIHQELPELTKLPGLQALFARQLGKEHYHLYMDMQHREQAIKHLQDIIYILYREFPAWKLQAKTAFLNFLFAISDADISVKQPESSSVRSHFLNSLDYLEKNFQRKITLNALAKMAGMSISSYTAQFRRMIGLSPMEYLINLRLKQVRQLLIHSNLELSAIAAMCGFCDSNYMIKIFRQREKITPGKLRRNQLSGKYENKQNINKNNSSPGK